VPRRRHPHTTRWLLVLTQFWNENLVYAVCLVQIMFQDQKATNVFLP
jgi:hypothetical protein